MKILVTGAAGGIGYLTSLTLAKRGHFVYLTCHTLSEEKNLKEKLKDYEIINKILEYRMLTKLYSNYIVGMLDFIKEDGRRVHLAGNIGYPLCSFLDKLEEGDIIVDEISCQQLENVKEYHHNKVMVNFAVRRW